MNDAVKRNKPRLIQGLLLKCVDGRWKDGDGLTPTCEMLAVATGRGVQCWKDKELLDEIVELPDEPLPDVDNLNSQIPRKEWGLGLDGQPRPPWALYWVAYLLDLESGQRYTFLNSTTGARIAVERLEDRMEVQRALRGPGVRPIVKLDARPMKTAFGQKMRPDFPIVEWRDFGGDGGTLLRIPGRGGSGGGLIELKPEPVPAPSTPTKSKKVGEPVKPVSIQEELDDDLPDNLKAPTNILKAG
jgi:hypothetical protein